MTDMTHRLGSASRLLFATAALGAVLVATGGTASASAAAPAGDSGTVHAMACPEIHNKPKYKVKKAAYFIAAKKPAQSTWLKPGQSVSWKVTKSRTFTATATVGAETEVGAIIAKAKASLSISVAKSWKYSGSQTVSDKNKTKKGFRAVLGNQGWKLTATKTWIVAPCNPRKKTIVVIAPKPGDLSIGHSKT